MSDVYLQQKEEQENLERDYQEFLREKLEEQLDEQLIISQANWSLGGREK